MIAKHAASVFAVIGLVGCGGTVSAGQDGPGNDAGDPDTSIDHDGGVEADADDPACTSAAGTWHTMSAVDGPGALMTQAFAWTDSELILLTVPHHTDSGNHGGRYTLDTDTWRSMDTAPWFDLLLDGLIEGHAHAWSGSAWYVWGVGYEAGNIPGGIFDPGTGDWSEMSTDGAPSRRKNGTGIWAGDRFMVWGGTGDGGDELGNLDTGALYDPITASWTPTSTIGAPEPRSRGFGFWTGTKVVIWGGTNRSVDTEISSGGLYDPNTGAWSPMSDSDAPALDRWAVWTGKELLVWNDACPHGADPSCEPSKQGYLASYDPVSNQWTPRTLEGAPQARRGVMPIWDGTRMIVWGGKTEEGYVEDGGMYDPVKDTWTTIPPSPCAPEPRSEAIAVWAGTSMIVWGGMNGLDALRTGGVFVPAKN